MQVYVNGHPVALLVGMTVKHALIAAGRLEEVASGKQVYDQWGNQMGLAGAVSDGMKLVVK